jgi:uncharacterized protein (DUF1810 family)
MTSKNDPHGLARFLVAQEGVYETAIGEIRQGAKRSHWMWFVFPQVAGLGHSPMARRYAIQSREEARAYLAHPVLGQRLRECVSALRGRSCGTPETIFGGIDALKLRSSLTLFDAVSDDPLFAEALDRLFGTRDEATLAWLGQFTMVARHSAAQSGLNHERNQGAA